MNDISAITTLISALRAETQENSITPERVGLLLQKLADLLRGCATDSQVVPGGTTPGEGASQAELDALKDVAVVTITPSINRTANALNVVLTMTEADGGTKAVTISLPMAGQAMAGVISGTDYVKIMNAIENMAILGEDAFFDVVKMQQLGLIAEPVLKAYIKEIVAETIQSSVITTENLTVTKAAHFFKLIIDELAASKGAVIISAANCKADEVVSSTSYFDVFFRATDADGAAITNTWRAGDMAICMSFNGLHTGFNGNATNKYYWRKVTSVASNITRNGEKYHRIRLGNTGTSYDPASTGGPEAGDEIVQLGYTGTDDVARQSAIIISAYTTPDTELQAPSLAFYRGINDFSLSTHRKTYFDATRNTFVGSMKVGPDEEDIESFVNNRTKYTHIAWCNDPEDDDPAGFTLEADGEQWNYIGICITTGATPPALPQNKTQYQWTYIRGPKGDRGEPGANGQDGSDGHDGYDGRDGSNGQDGEIWRLVPVKRKLTALTDGRVNMDIAYTVLHIKGNTSEVLDGTAMNSYGLTPSYRRELVNGTSSSYYSIQVGQEDTTVELNGTYAATSSTWNKNTLAGIRMRLLKGTAEVDADFVPLTLLAGAAFDVIQAGCESYIQANVQGTYALQSDLDATNQTVTNNQSTVTQRMDSITARVSTTETNYNTLSGNVSAIESDVSEINQKADSIELEVSRQSKVNENYIRNATLASLDWIDQEWTRTDFLTAIRPKIVGHAWRYTSSTDSPKLSGDTATCYCAILSSYLCRAAGDVPESTSITQSLSVTNGSTYTISIWARKQLYYGSSAFGIGEGSATIVSAQAYNSSGTVDSSVSITTYSSGHYVQFTPSDDNWHLFVVVMKMTASSIAPWFRVWGNIGGAFADWLISRPCMRSGNGIGTTTSAITSRTFVTSTANLFSYKTLTSTEVKKWGFSISVTIDGQAYGYAYNGSVVSKDEVTERVINRLWNTDQWANSLLTGLSVAAVNHPQGSLTRAGQLGDMIQEFPSTLGTSLQGKTLCFSAYIKRYKIWGGKAFNAGNATSIKTYGLGLKGTNISTINAFSADDTSAVGLSGPESFGSPVWKMCRFSPIATDDSWHRVWIVFTLTADAKTSGFKLGFHYNILEGGVADDWVISKPKLEIGDLPTAWTDYTGDEIKSGLQRTGIDIVNGKIRLDAETVEVANDLTIGGNTRVGGFIYNLQKQITQDMVHLCYNPMDYGLIDRLLLSYTNGNPSALYKTQNILFPECTSSMLFTDALEGRINVCLPFYYKLTHRSASGTGPYIVWPTSGNLSSMASSFGYSGSSILPEITNPSTSESNCGRFLLNQLANAQEICRRYLGSTVTIENNRSHSNLIEDNSLWVYGVKGIVDGGGSDEWYEFEPWNRATRLWSFSNYNNSSPREAEAGMIIDGARSACMPLGIANNAYKQVYRQGGEVVKLSSQTTFSTITVQAAQVVDDVNTFCEEGPSNVDEYGYYNGSYSGLAKWLPFIVPFGYFVRLKLVYEEGWFFWQIEAFGQMK